MYAPETAALMQFLAPGFLHTFGNTLFSIQGHAQLLQVPHSDLQRNQEGIMQGCRKSRGALELFRMLAEQRGEIEPGAVGDLLEASHDVLRVSVRDAGLNLQPLQCSAEDGGRLVDRRSTFGALAAICYGICAHLPTGYAGELGGALQPVDGGTVLEFSFSLQPDGRQLPFQVDLRPVQAGLRTCRSVLGMEFPGVNDCVLRCAPLPANYGLGAEPEDVG